MESTHTKEKKKMSRATIIKITLGVLLVGTLIGVLYFVHASRYIYTDKAAVKAPLIELSASHAGTLEAMYVHAGDKVNADTVVARVGDEFVKTKVAGIITSVQNNPGAAFAAGQAVAEMVDPTALRVEVQVDENKGLSDVKVGQSVDFTVDAFPGTIYHGIVDEVSTTALAPELAFSISDTRPTQQFLVKVRFDVSTHPELKNGMSAKVWISK